MKKYEVPDNLLYTKEHEWIKVDGDKAICGITDYAQKSLSDIVFVETPEIGREIKKNEVVCTIESVKSVSDVYSPTSGKIVDANERLKNEPDLINKSPYEDGWIFKLELADKSELEDLIKPEEYRELIRKIEEGR